MAVRTSSGQDAIVWDEWEFFNPLMNQGVEYKTIEKYESASLYKKIDGVFLNGAPKENLIGRLSLNILGLFGMTLIRNYLHPQNSKYGKI